MRVRALAGAIATALGLAGSVSAHEAALSRYTYWQHVRPVFEKHCAGCHREGGVGPMSLLEYQSAVPWSNAIKLQVLSRTMPPFLPDEENGPFRGARSLTAEELDVLIDWTVGATPEGEREERSAAPVSSADPHLVVEAAAEVVIGKDEYDETVCVAVPGLVEPRVLSGWTVRSQAPTVLRRAALYEGERCDDGAPLLTWLPDQARSSFPDGFGKAIAPGAAFALELRYVKGWNDEGTRIVDRPAVGLWFSPGAAGVRTRSIDTTASLASEPVELIALYPDVTGPEPLRIEAVEPDGTVRPLVAIEAFDPAWNEKYVFAIPVSLAAGTVIRASQPTVWADFVRKPPRAND